MNFAGCHADWLRMGSVLFSDVWRAGNASSYVGGSASKASSSTLGTTSEFVAMSIFRSQETDPSRTVLTAEREKITFLLIFIYRFIG